jgi:hypothetical protein
VDLTIAGEAAAPFVRLDSRTLVLSHGPRAVAFSLSSSGRFVEETLMIVLDEGRATRAQGDRVFGGFRGEEGGSVTLYGGTRDDLVVVAIGAADLERLQVAVTETVHHHH